MTKISFLSVESLKILEIKIPLAFSSFQSVQDLKIAALTSGFSNDVFVALFTDDTTSPETFITEEAMRVHKIHLLKEEGFSCHEQILICRHSHYASNVILERMPPQHIGWFNLCLAGPAANMLTVQHHLAIQHVHHQ